MERRIKNTSHLERIFEENDIGLVNFTGHPYTFNVESSYEKWMK